MACSFKALLVTRSSQQIEYGTLEKIGVHPSDQKRSTMSIEHTHNQYDEHLYECVIHQLLSQYQIRV